MSASPQQSPPEDSSSDQDALYQQSVTSKLSVVGIGASAGGLRALQAFFHALPTDSGLTFVVVVHLSPEHESVLAELIQACTTMPVQQVRTRVKMQPNHVYVIPPGKGLLVSKNDLELADLEMQRGRRLQIDMFFRSLAKQHGDGAAIILSGSGSDGAVGIQSIKEKGGLILVQDPAEAEYDGMPRSAIATGLVDIVGPVAELANQLVAAKETLAGLQLPQDESELSEAGQHTLIQILSQLRVRTGHDFSGYKRSTLLRRIARRMQINHVYTLSAYLQNLRNEPEEVSLLFRDILINVTEFFRDGESWSQLAEDIIPKLFEGKRKDDQLRLWVVGCATGEEVYTLAILLLEYADKLENVPGIQLFASDLGKMALEFAREGVYPEAIAAHLSDERLNRFFVKDNSHYRVRSELREMILFTPHNLLQDPPFSKLDLISCRNLLIYLQREIQDRVFESFHYALRPDGYLFLGSAESADGVSHLFRAVEKRHRIYQRRELSSSLPIFPSLPMLPRTTPHLSLNRPLEQERPVSHRNTHLALLEDAAPPSLLVDDHYNVLNLSETAGRYLQHPGGALTSDILRLVRPELQSELRSALYHAFEHNKSTLTRTIPVRFNGTAHPVSLLVRPRNLQNQHRALVFFLENEAPVTEPRFTDTSNLDPQDVERIRQIEAELRHAQNRLQGIREEYETTLEELRAANEELQSTNEEYKSTLEELETSKEELQSINEELHTVNQEMKNKVEELSHANSDLQNLFAATEIATIFLDRDLRVQRFTPRAERLFNFMPPDKGRPIAHLRANLNYSELEADARQVLTNLMPVEREVESDDQRWYLVGVRPYRTLDDRIDGVVITFVDVTRTKQTELELRDAKEYAESILDTVPDSLLVLQSDLRVKTANQTFHETFQLEPNQLMGKSIYTLDDGDWNLPRLHRLFEDVLPANPTFTGYEIDHVFERLGRRTMLINGRWLEHVELILLSITDITNRKQAEEALLQAQEDLELALEAASMGTWDIELDTGIAQHDLRHDQIFGYTERLEEWGPERFRECIIPEDREHFDQCFVEALETGVLHLEVRIRWPDGSIHWIYDRGRVYYDESGNPLRMVGVTLDVTERKEAQQAEIRQRLWQGQEAERSHLAREIHDGPIQELAALTFELTSHANLLEEEHLVAHVNVITVRLGRIINRLRHVMTSLRPPAVIDFGLKQSLEHSISDFQQQHPELNFKVEMPKSSITLPENTILSIYRIVQQALFNVIQHAEAKNVEVKMAVEEGALELQIVDDGIGFKIPEHWVEFTRHKHHGIVGMIERAEIIGGHIKIQSSPGQGTRIALHIPLP